MRLLIFTQTVDDNDPVLGFFVEWLQSFGAHIEQGTVVCLRAGSYTLPRNLDVVPLTSRTSIARALEVCRLSYQRRKQYEAVFIHMNPEYAVVAGWLWRLLGKRAVLWYTHKNVNIRLRIAVHFVHAVVTASPESFRLPSNKVHVLGHGISIASPRLRTAPSATLKIVTAGRISPTKHLLDILQAVKQLCDQGVPVALTIIGEPIGIQEQAYQQTLAAYAREVGIESRVRFRGAVPHLHIGEALVEADVFVNLSSTGSLDKAVLEAIVAGVVPVTSNEAFRAMLQPYGLYIETRESTAVAQVIRKAAGMDIHELQERVKQEHSLARLVPRLVEILARP